MYRYMRWAALMAFVTQVGCATTTTSESFDEDGLERAAFDLDCPKNKLTITILQNTTSVMGTRPVGTVGVAGCGKKATYVNTTSGWIKNSMN